MTSLSGHSWLKPPRIACFRTLGAMAAVLQVGRAHEATFRAALDAASAHQASDALLRNAHPLRSGLTVLLDQVQVAGDLTDGPVANAQGRTAGPLPTFSRQCQLESS